MNTQLNKWTNHASSYEQNSTYNKWTPFVEQRRDDQGQLHGDATPQPVIILPIEKTLGKTQVYIVALAWQKNLVNLVKPSKT